jgi:adenylylsulfate kinase
VNEPHKSQFPEHRETLNRSDKEAFLKQRAKVIWMTGLSGAGKTTIAKRLEERLLELGYFSQILDGDIIRSGINNNLSFTDADRFENIRRIAEVSKLFVNSGIITINCFISPTDDIREMAKNIIGKDDFIEVFVDAPFDVCEERDVKGLYSKARRGEIRFFTGIDSPYDIPKHPDLVLETDHQGVEESVDRLLTFILPKIKF